MRASAMVALAVLFLQFLFLVQAGRTFAGKELVAEEDLGGSTQARKPINSSSKRTRLQKAAGEAGDGGDGIHRRADSTSQLGTSKKPDSKRQTLPLSPLKSKSQGLQGHLKGHGKFNSDTRSCPGIHLKTCRKPSDCSGCLGLYTCRRPRGKCELKAVSRQTGGFSQSIQKR